MGDAARMRDASLANLNPFFTNPEAVYDALRQYLADRADGRTRFTYQMLYKDVLARFGARD